MKLATKWFIIMLIGGCIVFGITSVSMKFADDQAKQKVEDLKEQYYEELKEKYGF